MGVAQLNLRNKRSLGMQHYKEWVCIHTANEVYKVAVEEIVYVIADGNYSYLYLVDGTCEKFTFQIHYFEEQFCKLHRNPFSRIARSYLINKDHVRTVNVNERDVRFGGLTVSDKVKHIKIGRDSAKALKKELNEDNQTS